MTVKELEDVGIIREISVKKARNRHSVSTIRLFTGEENKVSGLKKLIGRDVCIEDDQRIMMRGTIREISCGKAYCGSDAVVKIISYSDKTDRLRKNRVFQDVRKKYKDIFGVLDSEDGRFQIIPREFAGQEEPWILLQADQTDFEFANELAHNWGYFLFVNDTDAKCSINIGKNCGGVKTDIWEEKLISLDFVFTEYAEQLRIRTRQFLELGQTADYDNQIYVVILAEIRYKDGATHFEYVLEREIQVKNHKKYATAQLGKAKVTANDDPDHLGRIQVEFLNYEDCMKENPMWIPYIPCLTEKDQGLVMIPGADEIVSVFCERGQGYANGCVRETALNNKIVNVQNRMIMLRDKLISISDEKIETELFSYKMTIEDHSFALSNEDNHIKSEKDKLLVKCGESKINLNGDTVQLLTKSKVDVKADQINLDGSSKISAKTSSFDVG